MSDPTGPKNDRKARRRSYFSPLTNAVAKLDSIIDEKTKPTPNKVRAFVDSTSAANAKKVESVLSGAAFKKKK